MSRTAGASARDEHVGLVVVGGGAMGLATAWHAARSHGRGRVVLLERFALGHGRGASHGRERIFRHAHTDRAYVEAALAADEGWAQVARDAGRPLLHRVGCVEHGPGTELEALAHASAGAGVVTERLGPAEAHRRWPSIRFDGDVLVQPAAGWLRAADAVAALARLATERGAELHGDTPVTGIESRGDDGVRVRAGDRTYRAPAAVVTAGAWVEALLPDLGLPPLTTTEEHVLFFRARSPVPPPFIHWGGLDRYGLPGPSGLVKVGEHHAGTVAPPDVRTFVPDARRTRRVERYVAEWLPGLVPEAVDGTTCLYTSTPTHDFVLDRVGPIVVGAGFSGHGFKFVPEVGRRLAALAAGTLAPTPPFTLASHRA